MSVTPYALCLWPGLPLLWLRGELRALATAIAFGIILNLALVSTWIWPEWIEGLWVTASWWTLGVWWLVAFIANAWRMSEESEPAPSPDAEALFREAQAEYLLGHWLETVAALLQLLEMAPADAEARLLLATVYRRRGQLAEALESLAQLERLDAAQHWRYEIAAERQMIAASGPKPVAGDDSAAADEEGDCDDDSEEASVPLGDGGKKVPSVDDPTKHRRAA